MAETKTIGKGYVIKDFIITSKNLSEIKINENRRAIMERHVGSINGALIAGDNSIGTLIVNKRGNEMRLIDGNHRFEALKRFFSVQNRENIKIECTLKIYNNLTDEEEREIYSKEANRKDEKAEDRLNIYKNTILLWRLINDPLREFPCKVSIYPSSETLKFRLILNTLNSYKTSADRGFNPRSISKESLISVAQSMGHADYKSLETFLIFFQDVFGKVAEENIYTKSQFFMPLFDIYMRNTQYANDSNFKERFNRVVGRSDIMQYIRAMGTESQIKIRALMISYMNTHISKNYFV